MSTPPPYLVNIAFLDVGQGDTIVITTPETGEAVVVDCVNADAVYEYLAEQSIKRVRGLIISHLHLDHYKDACQFYKNCGEELGTPCEALIFNWPGSRGGRTLNSLLQDRDSHSNISSNSKINQVARRTAFEEFKALANEPENEFICKALERTLVRPALGDTFCHVIDILQPTHGQMGTLQTFGLNDTSGILRVCGTQTSALLTGDIEPSGWRELLKKGINLGADILKFPHHGAWSDEDVSAILDAVNPSIVIISVGTEAQEKYKHPNAHVFDALASRPHIRVFCTEATSQCAPSLVTQRLSVIGKYEAIGHSYHISPRGCPCAGTVVVELSDTVRVLQPDEHFHRETIIGAHYTSHRCIIV